MRSAIVRGALFGDERVIRSLSGRTGMSTAEIRILFSQEFARLKLGAKVLSYLPALTASNVRALLRSAKVGSIAETRACATSASRC